MKRIYKAIFDLHTGEEFTAVMPANAVIVHIHEQHGMPAMWFLIERDDTEMVNRRFKFVRTGHVFEDNMVYLGTAHCGEFVWHVLELK